MVILFPEVKLQKRGSKVIKDGLAESSAVNYLFITENQISKNMQELLLTLHLGANVNNNIKDRFSWLKCFLSGIGNQCCLHKYVYSIAKCRHHDKWLLKNW